jgi:hypothetical protein
MFFGVSKGCFQLVKEEEKREPARSKSTFTNDESGMVAKHLTGKKDLTLLMPKRKLEI